MIATRAYQQHLRYRVTGEDCGALRERLPAARRSDSCVHTLRFTSYRSDADDDGDTPRYALHYFDNDPSYLVLERRGREARGTAMLTEAECRALLAGETDWLLDCRNPLLHDFHHSLSQQMLLPRVLLTYRQERYELERGAWVALDTDIRSTLEHMDFLDPEQLERETAGQPGEHLLEVGCRGDMPADLMRLLEEVVPARVPYPI